MQHFSFDKDELQRRGKTDDVCSIIVHQADGKKAVFFVGVSVDDKGKPHVSLTAVPPKGRQETHHRALGFFQFFNK